MVARALWRSEARRRASDLPSVPLISTMHGQPFLIPLLQGNFNHNIKLFIHKNASENIICEMVPFLSPGEGG